MDNLLDEFFKICLIELSNEKENFYAPFSEFSKILLHTYNKTNDENINYESIMYNYLDRYNGVLNARGYSGEYITKEKIIEKIDKYEDISWLFYKDGIVLPVCDTYAKDEDGSNYYMQVIEEDGSIKEILRKGYTWTDNVQDLSKIIQITSVEYFDIIGTSEYWKNIAFDSGAVKIFDLEPIPIYVNGELICIDSIDNIMIAVGQMLDENIAYKIKDEDSIIYCSDELAWNFSNYVPLRYFIKDYNPKDSSKLELANVFNDYYLSAVLSSDCFFSNLMVKDGSLKFVPEYTVRISKETGTIGYIMDNCYFFIENDTPILYPLCSTSSGNYGKVYLKDILTYYNVLEENVFEYVFTEEELMEYYENYIKDMEQENNNGMGL